MKKLGRRIFSVNQRKYQRKSASMGFTLLELLIVISIIAILAATIVPNFIGFDSEARISATMTNLNTLRTRVALYRAKEGEYPLSLEELLNRTYNDMGIQQPYLDKMPPEMISSKSGNNTIKDLAGSDELPGSGGWAYIKDKAKVVVDITEPLDGKWGKAKGEVPSEW
ncbi:MAG: type II secretion system protein [Candidatus Omnitrophota bacterium]|nr:type II secretion system protein [Candidatus Omnitrophota bacterium]